MFYLKEFNSIYLVIKYLLELCENKFWIKVVKYQAKLNWAY